MIQQPSLHILSGQCDGPSDPALKSEFKYDDFQNHAFNSIESNMDVFVSVPTSGGKTAVGEYAIARAVRDGKKVVYTTPIKALSNQKYKEFSKKFDFKIGLLTGDKKIDIDSPCVIATAEILEISLYDIAQNNVDHKKLSSDFVSSIGCVIMDEVHFMNDKERGHVWETTIILLGKEIQLIMLSATVSHPERFCNWVIQCRQRDLALITVEKRIIPLEHFIYVNDELYKVIDKTNTFSSEQLNIAKDKYIAIQKEREKNHRSRIDNNLVSNLIRFLKKKDLLQAIFFSFSKANCEKYAKSILCDDLIDHMERSEIEKMFYNELLPYKKEYENVPQVIELKDLLMKGIGFHHAGMLPVLKVIVENMFEAGFIKVLFATETFAVGINGSTRTVVMGELEKYTESGKRFVTTAEYKQMSGRAGRRGKDVFGNVILLPMYSFPEQGDLLNVAFGNVPCIESRFNWNYQFFLKTIQSNVTNIGNFFDKSLVNTENSLVLSTMLEEENVILNEMNQIDEMFAKNSSNMDAINTLIKYEKKLDPTLSSGFKITLDKKQQQEYKKVKMLVESNPELRIVKSLINKKNDMLLSHKNLSIKISANKNFVNGHFDIIKQILLAWNYVDEFGKPTVKGIIGAKINECNSVILTELITNNYFDDLTPQEIVAIMSIFTDPIKTTCGDKNNFDGTPKIHQRIGDLTTFINECSSYETEIASTHFANWNISYDYIDIALEWANGMQVPEILIMLNQYGEYEGNFVKNMLKICNIVKDVNEICKSIGKKELMPAFEQIESLILRNIVFFI